ncbi:hypothetical protein G7Y89_g298 [Cudoniella acicularis]|uniref:Glucosidase 2 subunit beta n=1 Tax=Cudoniella acicularis TaxID=354080 RepID=A0A8H4RZF2_9HELO|nr:hypothetical protein G7Y89_g298 [Cudoniella acicularis]
MNRFRTKKKTKEVAEGIARPSTDSDAASFGPAKKTRTFGRGKKAQEEPEPKQQLDLVNALPPSDDFRTSLLMSGLSARFSMLREQDDPKSKIGKASDDSVLFPKRQSRFNDLSFQAHGLSDIAEVSSINGSIRPPFTMERKDSYNTIESDGDSVHSGNIMNRAKPGEGNNLFGGRQKIYKIPMNASGSTRSLQDGGGMGGRALYGDDVSQSAFQKLREREREQERQVQEEKENEKEDQSSRPPSPPLSGYNRNRETSSTTSSAEPSSATRTSTAATSVTSQRTPSLNGGRTPISPAAPVSGTGLERSITKTRRLYETGLDQHLHEQQYSAMSRIDTLTRQRTLGTRTPPLNSPTGGFSPIDRWDRQQIAGKASFPNLRNAKTPPSLAPLNTFDFAVKSAENSDSKPFGLVSPPLSPPITEHDQPSVLPVQPNDRGKATATGAFSKPIQSYDENKYSQRQVQMQQGRETPPLRKHSPPRAFVPRQQQAGQTRGDSNATYASTRSRSNSSAQRHFMPSDRPTEPQPSMAHIKIPENRAIAAGTFLSSPNDSAIPSPVDPASRLRTNIPLDISKMNFQDQNVNLQRPPESQHPAHRQRQFQQSPRPAVSDADIMPPPGLSNPDFNKTPSEIPEDSPTLGPTATMTGLSGMVRQHLRSDSNSSSVYGSAPSGPLSSRFPVDPMESMPRNDYNSKSNPWEGDDWDQGYYGSSNQFALDGRKDLEETAPIPAPLSVRPNIDVEEDRKASLGKEMEIHHTRDGSTATQKEREDLKMDLAERRRRVKENMKSFVETESRSPSPLPGSDFAKDVSSIKNNALGLLKPKSSRGSLIVRSKEPGQSKAMKMLGIGSTTISSSPSPNRQNFDDDVRKQDDENAGVGAVQDPVTEPQTRAFRQARRDAQRDRERQVALRHQQRIAAEGTNPEWPSSTRYENSSPQREPSSDRIPPNIRTRQRTPSRERKPPPVTHSHRNGVLESKSSMGSNRSGSSPPSRPSRDRSSSDASVRSKSRNGRYRDDLAKAMAEGTASSSQGMYNELEIPSSYHAPRSPGATSMSPMPSPMLVGPNGRSRSRSNSRVATNGYPEPQKLQPIQTGGAIDLSHSPRPSPTAPFSINSTPAQPSPAGSVANTPTAQAFQSQNRVPGARKKSINKHDISEPKFVSSTSRIDTVNLPPEASLKNGMQMSAPPIPPVNPMRRQTTRGMFGALRGKRDEYDEVQPMPAATQSTEEMSTFSADEGDSKPRLRQKLRKSSSEGGNLNARARQAAFAKPSPAMPSGSFPTSRNGSPPRPVDVAKFYKSADSFTCISNPSITLATSQINDDYCDCPDGSDEPGTAACTYLSELSPPQPIAGGGAGVQNSTLALPGFYCKNKGHIPGYIPFMYVNDGVCDYEICCDGSDEWEGVGGTKCEDKCKEIGKEWKKLDDIRQKSARNALKKKDQLIKEAQELRAGLETSISKLEAEIKEKEVRSAELKKAFEDIERRERGRVVKSAGKGSKVTVLAGLAKQRVEELRETLVGVVAKRDALKEKVKQLEAILSTFKEEYNPNFNDEGVKRAVKAWEDYAANKVDSDDSAEERDIEEILKPDTEAEGINWAEWETEGEESDVDALYKFEEYLPAPIRSWVHQKITDLRIMLIENGILAENTNSGGESKAVSDARSAFQNANDDLGIKQTSLSDLQNDLNKDYGPNDIFRALKHTCISKDSGEYEYELCWMDKTAQKSKKGGGNTGMGNFVRFDKMVVDEEIGADGKGLGQGERLVMMYENGQHCWNGPNRQTTVVLGCAEKDEVWKIVEQEKLQVRFRGLATTTGKASEARKLGKGRNLKVHLGTAAEDIFDKAGELHNETHDFRATTSETSPDATYDSMVIVESWGRRPTIFAICKLL